MCAEGEGAQPESAENHEPETAEEPTPTTGGENTTSLLSTVAVDVATIKDLVEKRSGDEQQIAEALHRIADDFQHASRQEWRPLYTDLILLLDRIEGTLPSWTEDPAGEFLTTVRDEVLEILARRGVMPLNRISDAFDSSRQRAVKAVPTDDPEGHHRVVEVVRPGYECDGYILRPEEVVVCRYSDAREA
jgi:molecular chaperone GrpE